MDKRLLGLLVLFFIAFVAFIGFFVYQTQVAAITQAGNQEVSPTESLIFAWPLETPADGETPTEITIFVRTPDGNAVPDSQVQIASSLGTIQNPSAITDESGKAQFQLRSSTPGIAEVRAIAGGFELQRSITIQFFQP